VSIPPSTEELAEMGKFNEALFPVGIMLAGEGLKDSGTGRLLYAGSARGA
jgi:hypothetical protein